MSTFADFYPLPQCYPPIRRDAVSGQAKGTGNGGAWTYKLWAKGISPLPVESNGRDWIAAARNRNQ